MRNLTWKNCENDSGIEECCALVSRLKVVFDIIWTSLYLLFTLISKFKWTILAQCFISVPLKSVRKFLVHLKVTVPAFIFLSLEKWILLEFLSAVYGWYTYGGYFEVGWVRIRFRCYRTYGGGGGVASVLDVF